MLTFSAFRIIAQYIKTHRRLLKISHISISPNLQQRTVANTKSIQSE